MRSGTLITVRIRIMGPVNGQLVKASGAVQLKEGETVKNLFSRADAALGLRGERPFKKVLKQGIRPVVLINGDRLEIPLRRAEGAWQTETR